MDPNQETTTGPAVAGANPYLNLRDNAPVDPSSNPYFNLAHKDVVGSNPDPLPRTEYSKFQQLNSERAQAEKDYQDATSLPTMISNAINPINWAKGAFQIAKGLFTEPGKEVSGVASGLTSGITLGASDKLLDHLVKNKDKYGISDGMAKGITDFVHPQDETQSGLKGGFNLAGMTVPYLATDGLLAAGAKYAAPEFVANYAKTARILSDVAGFNVLGQTQQTIDNPDSGVKDRLKRAGFDTGAALLFPALGAGFRALKGTIFKTAANATEPVFADAGAGALESDLVRGGAKGAEAGAGGTIDLRPPTEAPGATGPAVSDILRPKTAITVPESELNPSATGSESQVKVQTNDVNALKNYIKGSSDINYKQVSTLGKDASGDSIVARHEFNPATGEHTIYTTNAADAGNLAHEMGHYFDSKLTDDTTKFSTLLNASEKNMPKLEDSLASYAVKDLGGNATGEEISSKISSMIDSMKGEIDALSSERRGGVAALKPSEKFADAVAQIMGGSDKAPVLSGFLEHATQMKDAQALFGRAVAKESKLAFAGQAGEKLAKPEAQVKGISLTQRESEQMRFRDQPDKITLTKERATGGEFKGIPPENIVHFNQGANPRVTAIVSSLDKDILGAAKVGSKNKEFVINKIVKEFDKTPEEARAYLYDRAKEIKALAKANADKENPVLINTIEKPNQETVAKAIAPEAKVVAAPDEKISPIKDESKTGLPDKSTVIEKTVEKAPELDRTPTGRQPATIPIKVGNVTTDVDAQKFIEEKILPKVEGKYRIAKSNDEIMTRALKSDLTEEGFNNILKERFGNLSEDVLRAKQFMTDSAVTLADQLGGREIKDLSAQEAKDILGQYGRVVETFETFAGVRTELSNSFRTLGLAVNAGENDTLRPALEAIQRAIGDEKDPFKIVQKVISSQKDGAVEKYFKIWYPAMLSGPKTQFRIALGSIGGMVTQTFSQLFTTEGRSEFGARVMGMIEGNKEAMDMAKAVFKGEKSIYGDFQNAMVPSVRTFEGPGAIFDYVGGFLSGNHAYWTTIYQQGEIAALEHGAYTYGLENKAIIDKLNETIGLGTGKLATYANQFEPTVMSQIGKTLNSLKNNDSTAVRAISRFFTPFVRLVSNITERKIDFIPILNLARTFDTLGADKVFESRAQAILKDADLMQSLIKEASDKNLGAAEAKEFAQGEYSRVKEIIKDRLKNQQLGRFYTGLAITAAGVPLALTGRITGSGPADKNQRALLMDTGWRPESIILPNGVAIPFQQILAPFAGILSVIGNISDGVRYSSSKQSAPEAVMTGFKNFLKGELDQSFLSGIASIFDVIQGNTSVPKFLAQMAVNAVPIPAAITQTKDIIFPERYEANTFNEMIRNKLGLTGNIFGMGALQPKLDPLGNQIKADLIYGTLPPLLSSKTDDPVLNFMRDNNALIGKPSLATQTITGNRPGEKRPMTPEEYTQFIKTSGQKIYDTINTKVQSGYFDKFKTDADKKAEVDKIAREIRTNVKSKIRF